MSGPKEATQATGKAGLPVASPQRSGLFRSRLFWLYAGLVVFGGLVFLQSRVFGSNDGSRWDTIWSLTSGQGYIIDDAPYPTVDKVYKDGHFYSRKPPFLPVSIAVLCRLAGVPKLVSLEDLQPFVLLALNVAPLLLLLDLYWRYLVGQNFAPSVRIYGMAAASMGTYLTGYLITLNNHSIAAYFAFFALYEFVKLPREGEPSRSACVRLGLFSALAAANELPGGALPAGILWLLARRFGRRAVFTTLAPMIVVAGLFLLLNYAAYGSVVPFYLMPQYDHYPGSYWEHPGPIDAQHEAKWVYLANLIVGHHGIFSLSPVFLVAVLGLAQPTLVPGFRSLALIGGLPCLAFLTVKTHNYGGNCQGPRWTFWFIPFFLFAFPLGMARIAKRAGLVRAAWGALAVSIFSVVYCLFDPGGPWGTSWLHTLARSTGLVKY